MNYFEMRKIILFKAVFLVIIKCSEKKIFSIETEVASITQIKQAAQWTCFARRNSVTEFSFLSLPSVNVFNEVNLGFVEWI